MANPPGDTENIYIYIYILCDSSGEYLSRSDIYIYIYYSNVVIYVRSVIHSAGNSAKDLISGR